MQDCRGVLSRELFFYGWISKEEGFYPKPPSIFLAIKKKWIKKVSWNFLCFQGSCSLGLNNRYCCPDASEKNKTHFSFVVPWIGRTSERGSLKWKEHFACLRFTHRSLKNFRNWKFQDQCVKWVSQKCCPEEEARLHINRNPFKG